MLPSLKKCSLRRTYQNVLLFWVFHAPISIYPTQTCSALSQDDQSFLINLKRTQENFLSKTLGMKQSLRQEGASLYIFVSFSLPSSTLKSLYRDVQKIGGKLVLRGLYQNSFKKTVLKLRELEIEVVIDPLLFRKYQITSVPTFLLLEEGKGTKMKGHVGVIYALHQMRDHGRGAAKKLLTQLEDRR